uniref:Polyglutamine-binding protein 1 n=1 Tax=Arion vulgaris TaxID=1028688 RepID=A0A0B6YR70_9EUPU
MPLPAALQARLAKRGIVDTKIEQPKTPSKPEEVEEVFAEDYDDPSKPEPTPQPQVQPVIPSQQPVVPHLSQGIIDLVGEGPIFFKTTACPNRSNPYHECLNYCKKRYGMREWDPDSGMIKRRDRMITRYPLPDGWVEVGDYDTGRFYYWNVHTDEVSWLSPTHPKAQISRPAENLGIVGKIGNLDSDGEEEVEEEEPMDTSLVELNSDDSGSDTSLSDEEEIIETKPKKGRGRQGYGKRDALDPMDPAAYSDIPRGGWSEGLDQRGKAKTGVDTTASGPLFQQRPYPSPGEILRANQGIKKKK